MTTNLIASLFSRFKNDEEGAAMVEYGLIVALIAVVVMAAIGPLGNAIAGLFNGVEECVSGTTSCPSSTSTA